MSTIVILDTGIARKCKKNNCILTLAVEKDNKEYFIIDEAEDYEGHGTMLYNLYNKLLPEEKYIIVRILKGEKVDERSLIFALKYIYKNIECDIIAISNGIKSCVERKELEEICLLLYKKQIMIIAAFANIGGITYPAAFDSVIGVDFTSAVNSKEYIWMTGSPVNYIGYCGNNILTNHKQEKINIRGNSFIVPYVVLQLVEYLKKGVQFENILENFKQNAKQNFTFEKKIHKKYFLIKKAIAFPCNKEIITLTKYACWLNFELQNIYDYKYSGNISVRIKDIKEKEFIIEDEEKIDWNSDFDTVILGHCGIKNKRIESVFRNFVKKALFHNKKIFSFDGKFLKNMNSNSKNIYYPKITKEDIPYNNLGKLYMPIVPLIGVFATGSKQGKFGTQLYLRREFFKRGYKVGQIGTEPISELFEFDEVYPVGYNSYNEVKGKEAIAVLNEMIKRVEEKEVDVIIFGSQSYTLPYEYSQLEYFVDYQDVFLKALRPDIVVLCVSVNDEIDYIKKTICYIEALGNSIVVGLVIAPINVKSNWRDLHGREYETTEEEMENFKKLIKCLEIPVYRLKNAKDMSFLAESCINWLLNNKV